MFEEKILIVKVVGYDFMEFLVDESDERLNRIYWSDEEIVVV